MPRVVFVLDSVGRVSQLARTSSRHKGSSVLIRRLLVDSIHPNLQAWPNSAYPELGRLLLTVRIAL